MPNTEEQRLDIIENCTILLDGILKPFEPSNDTPEGRMIYQCRWLKERAEHHDLPLPVDRDNLATLLYVYTNGEITHLASSQVKYWEEAEIHMDRLIAVAKNAKVLLKPPYYPYALRMIDTLLNILRHPSRPLNQYEQGSIDELERLKQLLADGKIEPPLMSYLPEYPNFRKVYRLNESTIDDLYGGKAFCHIVANLIFEGIRPDPWTTPEDADRATRGVADAYRPEAPRHSSL